MRDELAGNDEAYLRRWILRHGGARRHMNDYQIARWAYECAENDGWFEEAEKAKKATLKQGEEIPDSVDSTPTGKTETRIMEEYKAKQLPLRIYSRIKRIDASSPDEKIREKIWDIDMDLQDHGKLKYEEAIKALDKIEEKEEKPPPKPKYFRSNTPDLDLHAEEVDQAKERGELQEGVFYTPVHSYKPSTDKEIEKGIGVDSKDIGGHGAEKIKEAQQIETSHEEILEGYRKTTEHLEKELEEEKAKNAKWEARPEEKKQEILNAENHHASRTFTGQDVGEIYGWIGEELKVAMDKFGGPAKFIILKVEYGPKK